jgi:GntR family transcriptional regulator, sialic acid-inducible nan operon repressor
MVTTDRIQKLKLSDQVRERLLTLIRSDGLRPGDTLPSERDLMQSLGVGRPAIREAMQSLQNRGLVEIRHGDRARVAEPSLGRMVDQLTETMKHLLSNSSATLENLKDARLTFEMEMARLAARKRTKDDLARLEETFRAQEGAAGDLAAFRRLDGHFHRDLAALSGNPIWAALSDALFRWLTDFHVDLVSAPGLEAVTLMEHRLILDGVAAGDPARAAAAMHLHLTRANSLYRSVPAGAGPV